MCKKHPKYGAKRRPKANCKTCWEMWYSKQAAMVY